MENDKIQLNEPSGEALFRYQIISGVLVRQGQGEPRSEAIRSVSQREHISADGVLKKVSIRSIYLWLKAYETNGFGGLLTKKQQPRQDALVLEKPLLDFFKEQKKEDPRVSVPEMIRRAKKQSLIQPEQNIDRVTVWRSLKRMGIETTRRKSPKNRDSRRFAYPHRMDMVLCDGKHFRAGPRRLRRVALFFLDDSTRMGLYVIVGTSENTLLFLRGLYQTLLNHGLMSSLYVDNGSAFIANDSIEVLRKLGILFIHGTAGYPQGHGKIERFNRTAQEDILRFLDGNPEVDSDCSSLQLRLQHYLSKRYNQTPHESLSGFSPAGRFQIDKRLLRFHQSQNQLRRSFVLYQQRRVSNDNVVSFNGVDYEVSRGYAGMKIMLHRNILDQSISIIHQGSLLQLAPVDLHENARDKRAKSEKLDPENVNLILPKSSAQMAYERDLGPIVDPEGNFPDSL